MRIDGLDKQMNGLQREETFFILAGRSIGGTKVLLSGTSITHITRMVEPFISFASEIFNHFCRRGYGQLRPWNAGINVVCALRKPENIMACCISFVLTSFLNILDRIQTGDAILFLKWFSFSRATMAWLASSRYKIKNLVFWVI